MTNQHGVWGRSTDVSYSTWLFVIFTLGFSPLFLLGLQIYNVPELYAKFNFYQMINFNVGFWTVCWILFQLILYNIPDYLHQLPFIRNVYVGGTKLGHTTPTGKKLLYQINGLQSWTISHVVFIVLVLGGFIKGSIIANHWFEIFIICNILSICLAKIAYFKGLWAASYPADCKITESVLYDFFFGIEHNPRIGFFDFKLFFNGRPGIIAWSLINISFMFKQYENFGYVTNSMILLNILQGLYVVDFFWNENWYLFTIDIAHDHFGWYLAFGDLVWLPFFYTMQSVYLSKNPENYGNLYCLIISLLGIIGYAIFRTANYQKDTFKKDSTNHLNSNSTNHLNSNSTKYLVAYYSTMDGKQYSSKLMLSGLWGVSRHMNYTGDLILSLSYGLACGMDSIIPYLYFIFMLILLVLRCYRDEDKCSKKYGQAWNKYCEKVPYRLLPGIY